MAEMRAREAMEELERISSTGLLHPPSPSAAAIRSAFDNLGANGADSAAILMAKAHLLGGWIPLLRHGGPALASSKMFLALAATEPASGCDFFALRSHADETRDGWRLRGEKTFVTNAPVASHFLWLARTGAGPAASSISCFLLPRELPGLRVEAMPPLIGLHGAQIGRVSLEDAWAAESALLGRPGEGAAIFRTAMAWERSLILSSAPGTLESLLSLLVRDAAGKERFGGPLVGLPAFRRATDEVRRSIAELRHLSNEAARKLDSGENAVRSAMETKVRSSRIYESASRLLLQLGGAAALRSGSPFEKNFRDSLASSIYSGPNDLLEAVLASTKS